MITFQVAATLKKLVTWKGKRENGECAAGNKFHNLCFP